MVRRHLKGGHQCGVFDRSPQAVGEWVQEKMAGNFSLHDFMTKLQKPRAARLMVLALVVDSNDHRLPARPGCFR